MAHTNNKSGQDPEWNRWHIKLHCDVVVVMYVIWNLSHAACNSKMPFRTDPHLIRLPFGSFDFPSNHSFWSCSFFPSLCVSYPLSSLPSFWLVLPFLANESYTRSLGITESVEQTSKRAGRARAGSEWAIQAAWSQTERTYDRRDKLGELLLDSPRVVLFSSSCTAVCRLVVHRVPVEERQWGKVRPRGLFGLQGSL